jgi:hypothetical protein
MCFLENLFKMEEKKFDSVPCDGNKKGGLCSPE